VGEDLRGGDDDLGIYELLIKLGILALLVGGGDEGVSLILEPLADAKFILSCAYVSSICASSTVSMESRLTQQLWDLLGVLAP